jgi:hypothetical protein
MQLIRRVQMCNNVKHRASWKHRHFAGEVRDVVERSPIRYAALACVVAGGLLMGGTGAVAFADPDGSSGSTEPGPGGSTPSTTEQGTTAGTLMGVPPYGPSGTPYSTPTVGPVPVPQFIIPSRLFPLALPGAKMPPRLGPIIPWPNFGLPANSGSPNPIPPPSGTGQSTGNSAPPEVVPAATAPVPDQTPPVDRSVAAESTPSSPTISLLPLVPPGVATGPPITIKNPLPDSLPIDLNKPLGPQLPPPIVAVLLAASQQIPLTDLVVSPLMNDVLVPPLISDVIVPALLSDYVVPTLSLGSSGTGPSVPLGPAGVPASHPMALLLPSGPPPLDIAPGGMDVVPSAPMPVPSPLTPPPVVESPPPHQGPVPPDNSATGLNDQVAFRAGYSDYLRNAGMAQITSLAVPGAAAILLFTVGGGFIGYRQARAGHVIRAEGISRFLK